MFRNVAPPNIGPQISADVIHDPNAHQTELRAFSRDLKMWWSKHCRRLHPDGYEERKAYYKMRSMGEEVRLPESLIDWLKTADIEHDRRSWKAVEHSIMTARLFEKARA